MSLGENIKNKRQELKLSQEYIAEQLGISRQAVSKWETGLSEPTANNLIELAELFEISVSDLVNPEKCTKEQRASKKQPNPILRTNLSMLAISIHAGVLYSCTQVSYIVADDQKTPDYRFSLIKIALLFLCSLWMARNLMYEQDMKQRKKNTLIELLYCLIQLVIALCTYYFKMGVVGLALIAIVLLFYNLYINPKYMNRPFGKKQK